MATPPAATQLEPSDFPNLPDGERLARALNPFLQSTGTALRAGLTFRDNFQGYLKVLEVTAPEDWRDIGPAEMLGGWQLYPSNANPLAIYRLRVRKTVDGMVEAQGLVFPPSVSALGSPFMWPDGYTPAQEEIVALRGELQMVEVRTSALAPNIIRRETTGVPNEGWVSFSGLRYRAADRAPLAWTAPVDFALPSSFTSKPGAVLVLRAEELGTNAPVAAVSVDGWRVQSPQGDDARQIIRLPRINGLAPGLKYRLTLIVLPE